MKNHPSSAKSSIFSMACLLALFTTFTVSCSKDDDEGGKSSKKALSGIITTEDGSQVLLTSLINEDAFSSREVVLEYDAKGNLTRGGDHQWSTGRLTSPTEQITYELNAQGYVSKMTVTTPPDPDDAWVDEPKVYTFTYNSDGELTFYTVERHSSRTDSDGGKQKSYLYEETSYTWKLGDMIQSVYTGYNTSETYDAKGKLVGEPRKYLQNRVVIKYNYRASERTPLRQMNPCITLGPQQVLGLLGYFGKGLLHTPTQRINATYTPVRDANGEPVLTNGEPEWKKYSEYTFNITSAYNPDGTLARTASSSNAYTLTYEPFSQKK